MVPQEAPEAPAQAPVKPTRIHTNAKRAKAIHSLPFGGKRYDF